jgi:hypothetical protein
MHTEQDVMDCAANVQALYRTYSQYDWRLGNMEFLDDQLQGAWQPAVFYAGLGDMRRYSFYGYVI